MNISKRERWLSQCRAIEWRVSISEIGVEFASAVPRYSIVSGEVEAVAQQLRQLLKIDLIGLIEIREVLTIDVEDRNHPVFSDQWNNDF